MTKSFRSKNIEPNNEKKVGLLWPINFLSEIMQPNGYTTTLSFNTYVLTYINQQTQ